MIITVGGTIGSGKSTLARMLAGKLGYKHYYMGGMRREIARSRGMTLHELNALGEREDWTDREIDDYQKKLGATEDDFVIEGRTSFHFIPHSLKIFIACDERVAAERIFHDLRAHPEKRNEAHNLRSIEDVLRANQERIASDIRRYHHYYNLDVYDKKNYDFLLDTTHLDIPSAFEKLYEFVKTKL